MDWHKFQLTLKCQKLQLAKLLVLLNKHCEHLTTLDLFSSSLLS